MATGQAAGRLAVPGAGTGTRPAHAAASTQPRRVPAWVQPALLYGALAVASAIYLGPFAWTVLTSFKTQPDAMAGTLLPRTWSLDGYRTAFGSLPFTSYFMHSMLLAIAATASNVAFAALAGYAFARMRFPGSNVLFAAVLGSMMVPDQVRMVPVFRLLASVGLIDSYSGVWLLQAVTPMGIFLMRQHFRTMPRELEESARLDGAGYFTTFYRIMLPLAGPGMATLAILTFQGSWNEFFWPLLILQDPKKYTLPQGLAAFTSAYQTQWPPLMAATIVATLPVLVLFIVCQRYFVGDATTGAVK